MYIYFMRHGETIWNRQGRIQGSTDIALTDLGISLAELSRDGFAGDGILFDRIYSSPYQRALRTAEIVSEKTLRPDAPKPSFLLDDRLKEMCFGKYEGMTLKEIKKRDDNIQKCFQDPAHFQADETGENYRDVFARTDEFLEKEIRPLEAFDGLRNVLVLCHGTIIRAFLATINHIAIEHFWDMPQPNCSINKVELKNGVFRSIQERMLYYESEDLTHRGIL